MRLVRIRIGSFFLKFSVGDTLILTVVVPKASMCSTGRRLVERDWVGDSSLGQTYMSCSIRVRIVWLESWSCFVVSSILRSRKPHHFCTDYWLLSDFVRKDENFFRFFPWKCFALTFPLKALLRLHSFQNGRQGGQTLKQVPFNGKARNTFRPKNYFAIPRKIILDTH